MDHVPRRIEIAEGASVEITWEDDTVTELDAPTLRAACMCAVCREPAGEAATQAVLDGDDAVLIASAELVGGYAIRFVFEPDGHGTGIYPFAKLRELVDGWG